MLYLKKATKAQVDDIVDELAKIPTVAECYASWSRLRDDLESYYKDTPQQHLPLSQQKEFRAIKNLVIQEAEKLEALQTLEQLWDNGFTMAAHHLGRARRAISRMTTKNTRVPPCPCSPSNFG